MNDSASPSTVSREARARPDGAGCLWGLLGVEILLLLAGGLVEWAGWLDIETWIVWGNAGLLLVLVVLWLASSVSQRRPRGDPGGPAAAAGQGEGSGAA
jgi:hypothetical protein